MSWKEYKKKLGVKHNFAKWGCKEFWVILRRVDSFPYGEAMRASDASSKWIMEEIAEERAIGKTAEDLGDSRETELQRREEAELRRREKARRQRRQVEEELVDCLLDWHITDPTIQDEAGISDEDKARSLPLPTKDDMTVFDKLPSEFVAAMLIWLREDSDLAKRVPKGTGTPSGRR